MRPLHIYADLVLKFLNSQQFRKFLFGFTVVTIVLAFANLGYEMSQIESVLSGDKILIGTSPSTTIKTEIQLSPERQKQMVLNKKANNLPAKRAVIVDEVKHQMWLEKINKLNEMRTEIEVRHVAVDGVINANSDVHIFYYAWYENDVYDGNWQHWNHEYLGNWKKDDRRVYPTGRHVPPDDIGSNYYPQLGCYSSRDPDVLDTHMRQIKNAGIGVLIVSWYPPGMSDGSARSPDTVFQKLLNAAKNHRLKIAPHIEPYENRNPHNFLKYLKYFQMAYGNHPALYKMKKHGRDLTVYYIYDSYRTPAWNWRELMDEKSNTSLRGTPHDGIFLGLLVNSDHKNEIKRAHFDGFYTYFATNGFSFGSSWKNWRGLAKFARLQNLIFIPSVGPGYIDTRVRPWNSANTRHRRRGKYYEVGWRAAMHAGVDFVSITSFNEWHEGTQIEPAVAKRTADFTYLDYEPEGPEFYLNLTKFWIYQFTKKTFSHDIPIM